MACNKASEYKKFGDLAQTFKICIQNEWLIVKPRVTQVKEANKFLQLDKQICETQVNIEQIVGFLVQNNPKEVYFPNVKFNDALSDMNTLYKYCQSRNLFIINQEEAGLTITTEDPDNLAWSPPNVS